MLSHLLLCCVSNNKLCTCIHSFCFHAAAAAKSLQLCPTLCDPIDGSPPGSLIPGFSRQEHWSGLPFLSPMYTCMLSRFSHVQLCATLWTAAHQAPLPTGFSGQEYWSGLPCGTSLKDLFPVEFVFLGIEDEKNSVKLSLFTWTVPKIPSGLGVNSPGGEFSLCILPISFNKVMSTSWEALGWKKHKLESRLLGEISITSDMQITPPKWQKVKKNERASWWEW